MVQKQNRDSLWVLFPLEKMKYFIFSFLFSGVEIKRGVTQHAMPPEFREVPSVYPATGYSVKLKKIFSY